MRKLDQREALPVAITEHTIMLDWTSDILGLTIDAAMNVIGKGVVCGLNIL